MINIIKQNRILFIILAVIIMLFIAYGFSDKTTSSVLIQKQAATDSSSIEQEILQLLMDVQSIKLDGSVFQDPTFNQLRDFGRKVIQEPTGKINPFLPDDITDITDITTVDTPSELSL